jgi:hypothetical protein
MPESAAGCKTRDTRREDSSRRVARSALQAERGSDDTLSIPQRMWLNDATDRDDAPYQNEAGGGADEETCHRETLWLSRRLRCGAVGAVMHATVRMLVAPTVMHTAVVTMPMADQHMIGDLLLFGR